MEDRESETRTELEELEGELLPDRESMSTIWPGPEPASDPTDLPLDAPEPPAPE